MSNDDSTPPGPDFQAGFADLIQQPIPEKPDPVREILAQPKLTPEQREQKRKELLERQREARNKTLLLPSLPTPSANDASSSAPQPLSTATTIVAGDTAPLRENMITQATAFLNAPSVRAAEMSKKIAFLENKGLNRREIDVALQRAGDGAQPAASSTAPPPVPARPVPLPGPVQQYPVMQQFVVYKPPPPVAFSRVLTMAVLASVGVTSMTVGLLAVVKVLVHPFVMAFSSYRGELYHHQADLLLNFTEDLKSLNTPWPDDEFRFPIGGVKPLLADDLAQKSLETRATLSELLASLRSYSPPSPLTDDPDDPLTDSLADSLVDLVPQQTPTTDLRASIASLMGYITQYTYPFPYNFINKDNPGSTIPLSPSGPFGGVDAEAREVQEVKTEIRSLKGMLLNRRNFPMVGAISPSLISSAATSPKIGVPSVPVYYRGSGSKSTSGSGGGWNPPNAGGAKATSPYRATEEPVGDYLTMGARTTREGDDVPESSVLY
ncbi:peroxisomal membrane anchor protein conserved region-domain-containing protein [Jimgerdemannia flammicorona]|uniref:Peroxisomal membrane protein PEX14 n=1 Tax=Jimgerdemannia flammicorona TaxID=994334 RepID=A0A433B9K3_9FUNG|nr:peroxisomal membrane anchor protein conserved region-domain-containing protein [Jimgerdemannia flammicorona]